jgi:hypothetical protein
LEGVLSGGVRVGGHRQPGHYGRGAGKCGVDASRQHHRNVRRLVRDERRIGR